MEKSRDRRKIKLRRQESEGRANREYKRKEGREDREDKRRADRQRNGP